MTSRGPMIDLGPSVTDPQQAPPFGEDDPTQSTGEWSNQTVVARTGLPAGSQGAVGRMGNGSNTTNTGNTGNTGGNTEQPPPEVPFEPALIPSGATLIKVTDPSGSDAKAIYYAEYTYGGVKIRFEIGNRARVKELFGEDFQDSFDGFQKTTQTKFDDKMGLTWGSIDEQLGTTESIASQVERGLREAGAEDIADWQRNSTEAMLVLLTGAKEGWSSGRILTEMSKTNAFGERYSGFEAWRAATGSSGNLASDLEAYVAEEDRIKGALRTYRGPSTDLTNQYVGTLLGSGWSSSELTDVLKFERQLTDTPEALDNLNELLALNNLGTVDAAGMFDIIQGRAAPEVFEVLNDAVRQTMLEQQGLTVSAELAASLGPGSALGLDSPEKVRELAQQVAMDIFSNRTDLDLGKYGLTEAQILQAAFNGEATSEVYGQLARLGRERSAAAAGFEEFNAFQGEGGRVQFVGLGNL